MVSHSEKHGLRVFANSVLGKIFGPKRGWGGGVTGDWRKLHDEELHNLCSTPDVTGD
jgi:hypothetical protein